MMHLAAFVLVLLSAAVKISGQATPSPSPAAIFSPTPASSRAAITLCGHPDDGATATCGLTTSGGLAAAIAPFILIPFLAVFGVALYGCLAENGIDPRSALTCGCLSGSGAPPPSGSLRTTTSQRQRPAVRRSPSSGRRGGPGSGPGLLGAGSVSSRVAGTAATASEDSNHAEGTAAAAGDVPEIHEVSSDGALSSPLGSRVETSRFGLTSPSAPGSRSTRQSAASALAALPSSAAGHSFFAGPASGGPSAASPLRLRDASAVGSYEASPRPLSGRSSAVSNNTSSSAAVSTATSAGGRAGSGSRLRAAATAARLSRSPSLSPARAPARASAAVPASTAAGGLRVGSSLSPSRRGTRSLSTRAVGTMASLEIESDLPSAGAAAAAAAAGSNGTARSPQARPMRYSLSSYASASPSAAGSASAAPQVSGGLRAGLAPSRRPQAFP